MPAAPNSGDIYQDCVDRVNQFRACMCLPALKRWTDGEACANQDATYDAMNQSMGAHAGFKAKICAAGNAQDECPGWQSETQVVSGCLQQMFDEGPPPSQPCTGKGHTMPRLARCSIKPRNQGSSAGSTRRSYNVRM